MEATLSFDAPDDTPRAPRAIAWHPDGRALTVVHRGCAHWVDVDPALALALAKSEPLLAYDGSVCVSDDGAFVWSCGTFRPVALFGRPSGKLASFDDGLVWLGNGAHRWTVPTDVHIGRPHFAPTSFVHAADTVNRKPRAIVRYSGLTRWWSGMRPPGPPAKSASNARLTDPPFTPYAFMSWSPCGTWVLMRRGSDTLRVFEVDAWDTWIPHGEVHAPGLLHAAMSPDGASIALLTRQSVRVVRHDAE